MSRHDSSKITPAKRKILAEVDAGRIQRRMTETGWEWLIGGARAHGTDTRMINELLDTGGLITLPTHTGAAAPEPGDHQTPTLTSRGRAALP